MFILAKQTPDPTNNVQMLYLFTKTRTGVILMGETRFPVFLRLGVLSILPVKHITNRRLRDFIYFHTCCCVTT